MRLQCFLCVLFGVVFCEWVAVGRRVFSEFAIVDLTTVEEILSQPSAQRSSHLRSRPGPGSQATAPSYDMLSAQASGWPAEPTPGLSFADRTPRREADHLLGSAATRF